MFAIVLNSFALLMLAIVLSHTFDEYKVVQVVSCFDTAFAEYPFFNAIPIDVFFLVLY